MNIPTGLAPPAVSLIVGTRGREWQIDRLLESLEGQTLQAFEVIVVDQNDRIDLRPLLDQARWPFPIKHLHRPTDSGLSLARNIGWRCAGAAVCLFPDDDSWYPADFLEVGLRHIEKLRADLLTGRSADESGRSINGRFAVAAGFITRRSVWRMQQEWVTLIRRSLLEKLGGYDEAVGTGGPTPWQAAEGPDLILRALAAGACCRYEPSWVGHHDELRVLRPDDAAIIKGLGYARGKGYVLHKHHRSVFILGYWLARPTWPLVGALLRRDWSRARYLAYQIVGRWEGWLGRSSCLSNRFADTRNGFGS